MIKPGITLLGLLTFTLCFTFGQKSNIVPSENFPQAKSNLDLVKNLELPQEPVLSYTQDVVYVKRGDLDLHIQLVAPRRDARSSEEQKGFPCIIYIQGSAWKKQNVYVGIPQLAKFASRGFVIASVEYRHSERAPFPAQVQDTKTAIRFMRKNAEKFHIDPNNMFVWGGSSGGHTAVMAGITSGDNELDTEDYGEYSDEVNAIVDFFGPTDIVKMNFAPSIMNHSAPNSPEGLLIGGLEVLDNREKAQTTNPINYISEEKSIPPILVAHGDMDRIVPFDQSELLAVKLKETGKEFEYYSLTGAGHGTPEFWSNEMLDIVEGFLKKYMKEE